jgi:hypothetical protein
MKESFPPQRVVNWRRTETVGLTSIPAIEAVQDIATKSHCAARP